MARFKIKGNLLSLQLIIEINVYVQIVRAVKNESSLKDMVTDYVWSGLLQLGDQVGFLWEDNSMQGPEEWAQVVRRRVCKEQTAAGKQHTCGFLLVIHLLAEKTGTFCCVTIRSHVWWYFMVYCFPEVGQAASLFSFSRWRNHGSELSSYLPWSHILKSNGAGSGALVKQLMFRRKLWKLPINKWVCFSSSLVAYLILNRNNS